jgi:lipopolysaccharide export system protein LptA
MNRRIALLVGSFVALVAAFLIATALTADPNAKPPRVTGSLEYPSTMPTSQPGQLTSGIAPEYFDRDATTGRLKAVYRAESWRKVGDASYQVIKPSFTMFDAAGRQTLVSGDSGLVHVQETAGRITRGTLTGNVRCSFERDPRQQSDVPSPNAVHILADDMSFDKTIGEISTAGPVQVRSDEVDAAGKGLLLQWSDKPLELQKLQIEKGEYLTIKNLSETSGGLALPGRDDGASPAAPAAPAATQAAARDPLPAMPNSMEEILATFPDLVTTQPTGTAAPQQARNIYHAKFLAGSKAIEVDSPQGQMRGAQKLSLVFPWDRDKKKAASAASGDDAAASGAASAPARKGTLTVRWDGALVLEPRGRVATVSQRRVFIAAEGDKLRLQDQQMTADCHDLAFMHPQQIGQLNAGKGAAVVITMATGEVLTAGGVRFNRPWGLADLIGAGSLTAPAGQSGFAAGSSTGPASAPAAPGAVDRIAWSDRVLASFAADRGPDGKSRQFIRTARFLGKTELTQGRTGDWITCDQWLDVTLARTSRGGAAPQRATAVGNVLARQQDSSIKARQLDAEFIDGQATNILAQGDVVVTDARPNEHTQAFGDKLLANAKQRTAVLSGTPKADGSMGARIARGDELMEGNEIRLYELAEEVFVEGAGRLRFTTDADLSGAKLPTARPITIAWSKSMRFAGSRDTAEFTGDVAVDSDLDRVRCPHMTAKLPKSAAPATATAPAGGLVAAALQPPAGKKAAAAPTAATRPDANRLGLGLQGYSGRQLTEINADGGVFLQSRRVDEKNRLVQRLTMSGPALLYLPADKTARVTGAGKMLVEDYRPPTPRTAKPGAALGADSVESPSQTAFEWHNGAFLDMGKRWANMEGEVGMVHMSADRVKVVSDAQMPDFGKLPPGREVALSCSDAPASMTAGAAQPGRLEAFFGAPDAADKSLRKTATQPSGGLPMVGPLDRFLASGLVTMKDDKSQIQAARVTYDRLQNMAVIYGYLSELAPKTVATLVYEDIAAKTWRTVKSTEIVCYLKDGQINRVETAKVSAAGVK